MAQTTIPGPEWIPVFLETLVKTRKVKDAVAATGRDHTAVYAQRKRNQQFADAWEAAKQGTLDAIPRADPDAAPDNAGCEKSFFRELAQTSNVRKSAEKFNIPLSTIYARRKDDTAFARKWEAALFDGYAVLEMEVLGYLRDPKPGYRMDVANALRLLAVHREAVAREAARRGKRDKAVVLASLNARIDRMRERKAAAEKLLLTDARVAQPGFNERD